MPVYEFRCKKCDRCFDLLLKSLEASRGVTCPGCGAKDVERLLSTFSCSKDEGGAAPGGHSSTSPAGCGGAGPFK